MKKTHGDLLREFIWYYLKLKISNET